MTGESTPSAAVRHVAIDANHAGQRLDNFLLGALKGVPKSLIYRILRRGEVRVNKGRSQPAYRLQDGDIVRIPPVRTAEPESAHAPSAKLAKVAQLGARIIFEDNLLLAIDKPADMAVHGGSGVDYGLIEALRVLKPECRYLELVHRLDRGTSGVILVAKKRRALTHLQDQLRNKQMRKTYLTLVHGHWPGTCQRIDSPLLKYTLPSGERRVRVDPAGKPSVTGFSIAQRFAAHTLLRAHPRTGRTHQIRIHSLDRGHPIVGDDKYGRAQADQAIKAPRLFLHAESLQFTHPDGAAQTLTAALPEVLTTLLEQLPKR